MKKNLTFLTAVISFLCFSVSATASIMSVSGPLSTSGIAPGIIGAPLHVLDDIPTNLGMQGFNEAQGVVTSVIHNVDGPGVIAAGSFVDSHMIFLNSPGGLRIDHLNVAWTFSGNILGVMSDSGGNLEAASSFELGAPGTNYTLPFGGSGPAAPFNARGMEGGDSYAISGNVLTVNMIVTEPGDWIRVVTAASPVPEPATMMLFGIGLLGIAGASRKKS